jgi:hypothetical protein
MTAPATRLRLAVVAIGLVTTAWACLGLGARASYGGRTTADEPQYLLTAISLWEDGDLEITDELAAERYRPFHEAALPVQTQPVDDSGRLLSPHDPLLPVLLAVPMGLGGWVGAKLALAVMAGVLAGLLTWVAVQRFDVPLPAATVTVGAFSLGAPLSAYGTQVYPELPAALAVTVAVAALTGRLRARGLVAVGLAVVALPWLGVKYVPVAVALAAVAVVVLVRRRSMQTALAFVGSLALAGAAYLVAHRVLYGGWTVYAAGDHFVEGELSVVGVDPDHLGRSRRLVALLVDRGFGLVAWAPVFLVAVAAVAALLRRRPVGWAALVVPLAAGYATATWVALTMHGWWWPGRQVVVVVPCLVLASAWFVGQSPAWLSRVVVVLGAMGLVLWGVLTVEALRGELTLVVDFETTANPLARAWRLVLPDYRDTSAATWLLQAVWLPVLGGLAIAGWRAGGPVASAPPVSPTPPPTTRRYPPRVPV